MKGENFHKSIPVFVIIKYKKSKKLPVKFRLKWTKRKLKEKREGEEKRNERGKEEGEGEHM